MNALQSIADHCGIELSFEDARGEAQRESPESIAKILAAMNEAICNEAQAGAVHARWQTEDWRRTLAPVRRRRCAVNLEDLEANSLLRPVADAISAARQK
jgi:hypothetical protein